MISGLRMLVLQRWLGAAVVATALVTSGCTGQHEVKVTVKAAEGEEAEASTEEAAVTEAAGYGNLVGTVTFEGDAPHLSPLVKAKDGGVKDAAVCAAAEVPDESMLVNAENKGIANVVIFLDKRPKNIKEELAKPPTDPVIFDQKGCRFLPHILTVQIGQPLLVKSDDAIAHNTHTNPFRNTPFNQAIKADDRVGVPCNYSKAENGPIEVKCDLHPWMRAYHFPVDHPYVAITDENGKFRIDGLPAGTHTFKVWHEKAPGDAKLLERKLEITIEADSDTTQDLAYGGSKFAYTPRPAHRSVAVSRLQAGGELILTQTEGNR